MDQKNKLTNIVIANIISDKNNALVMLKQLENFNEKKIVFENCNNEIFFHE